MERPAAYLLGARRTNGSDPAPQRREPLRPTRMGVEANPVGIWPPS